MNSTRRTHLSSFFLFLVLLSLLSLAQSGCSSDETRVVGKWREKGKTEVMEFFKDGKLGIADKGQSVVGTWTNIGDGRIRVEVTYSGTNHSFTVTTTKDALKADMGGQISEYERIP